MATITSRRQGNPDFWQKREAFRYYPLSKGGLFVPAEDMWLVHDASTPQSVIDRAKLRPRLWEQWETEYRQSRPWFFPWLYEHRYKLPEEANGFRPTLNMEDFRREACIKAVCAAATRSAERLAVSNSERIRATISDCMVHYWLNDHHLRHLPWLKGWLVRGEKPPRGVTIATLDQVRRFRQGFDHFRHCLNAGIKADATYREWLGDGRIPNLQWLKWLYGWSAPVGSFVVPPWLHALRREWTPSRICALSHVALVTLRKWQHDAQMIQVFDRMVEVAAQAKRQGKALPAGVGESLTPDVRHAMWTYARFASPQACRERAEVSHSSWSEAVREAARCGVEQEFKACLTQEGHYKGRSKLSGLVADRFFLPNKEMTSFRKAARQGLVRLKAFHDLPHRPGFDEWFADMTRPGELSRHRCETAETKSKPVDERKTKLSAGSKASANGHETMPSAGKEKEPDAPPPPPMPPIHYPGSPENPFYTRVVNGTDDPVPVRDVDGGKRKAKNRSDKARHSPDFASVHWFGTNYTFTGNQAAAVKLLWEAWENGTPDVRQETLLEGAACQSRRLVDVFKDRENGRHPAWETMIVSGEKRGTYRLQEHPT